MRVLIQIAVVAHIVASLGACGGSNDDDVRSSSAATTATTMTVTPTQCDPPPVASSDLLAKPKKPAGKCATVTFKIPEAAFRAKQALYLATWKTKQAQWTALSPAEQDEQRRLLKKQLLGE